MTISRSILHAFHPRWVFTSPVLLLTISLLFFFCGQKSVLAQNDDHRNKPNNEGKEKKTPEGEDSNFWKRALRRAFQQYKVNLFDRPYRLNALPIVYLTPRTGVNLGFYTKLRSRGPAQNEYDIILQIIASTLGSHNHKIVFKYPEINQSNFGFFLQAAWRRDLETRYFGIGNNSLNEENLTDPKSPDFVHEEFYIYNLKRPRLTLYGTYRLLPNIQFWYGFGLHNVEPQFKHGVEKSFLASDKPFGYLGGSGNHLSFRLSWDTRSESVFPLSGFLTEVTFEPNFENVNEIAPGENGTEKRGKEVTFYRYTISDAHFTSITNRLIFANRVAFEAIAGQAPYYAFGESAGQRLTRGLGGSQSLRGYKSRRFQDKIKFFTLTELRYKAHRFKILPQPIDLIIIGFYDSGRVWHRWSEIEFKNFHATFGFGIWLNWNNNLILRMDVGRSREQLDFYLRFNSAF
ncbi:MAG: BamA/TamA family outer membrane protein [bacterium]